MPLPHSPVGCPLDSLLRLLMGPWTTYILWVLRSQGPTRFGALKRRVPGISAKVLTERLRMLEAAGVVYRHYEPTIPPRVTYGLTERGDELREVLDQLNRIALAWRRADAEAASARPGGGAALPLAAASDGAGASRLAGEQGAGLGKRAAAGRRPDIASPGTLG